MWDFNTEDFISHAEMSLFPRKFDQSRWILRYDVDLALRSVKGGFWGWGGHDGELIAAENTGEAVLEGWSECYYRTVSGLWAQLEVQLDPNR